MIFTTILFLFCYFRLKPLYFQTVGYTYDQGRDFLKTAEVVLYKNPTFIGPTTGIMGLYHGAWWYYLLAIPFIIFGASPIGFYYFNFFIHLVSFLLLAYFLKKNFGLLTSFLVSTLIAISPYFIFTSIFVGNNIMILPLLLFFLLINYYLLENKIDKKTKLIFLSGLLLGFIAEFEIAFGLFIIPAYVFLFFLFKKLRSVYLQSKNAIFFLIGLLIPFLPRVFFEFKHQFLQTKILLNFLLKPKLYNPKPYIDILKDRLNLFEGYYKSIFASEILALVFFCLLIIFFLFTKKIKKSQVYKSSLPFYSLLLFLLFFLSTLFKDNFWGNYYEGLPYLFLFIMAIVLSMNKSQLFNTVKIILLSTLLLLGLYKFSKDIKNKPKNILLQGQSDIVDYVAEKNKDKNEYCVKIYTPPVIPYTYDYLFLYKKLAKKTTIPQKDWIENRCWFIIEPDDYKERRDKWLKANIQPAAKLISETGFAGTKVALYEKKNK